MSTDQSHADYLRESARPLTALCFVAPLLITYELGILWLGPTAMRNGAEQWLRQLLDWIGFGQYLLLPILTCLMLLAWQHISREPWHFRSITLYKMVSETCLVAIALVVLAYSQAWLMSAAQLSLPDTTCQISGTGPVRAIGFFGAGIYEELLFRLLLIPSIAGLLRYCGEAYRPSLWTAAIASSLIFSAAHYQVFVKQGDVFVWNTFLFRFMAGMIFSALFIKRGFGISAGAHTLYDIIVGSVAT